ncbi:MAG: hypothetical protein RL172_2512 [Bacteroidota bacterium]|jgi:hypothetical protein
MKKLANQPMYSSINHEFMNALIKVVPEKLALDIMPCNKNVFTAAQLWSIQNRTKVRSGRRFF